MLTRGSLTEQDGSYIVSFMRCKSRGDTARTECIIPPGVLATCVTTYLSLIAGLDPTEDEPLWWTCSKDSSLVRRSPMGINMI